MVLSYNTILNMADANPNNNASSTAPSLQDLLNVGLGNGWSDTKKKAVLGDASNGSTVDDKTFEKPNNLSLFTDVIGGKTKDQVTGSHRAKHDHRADRQTGGIRSGRGIRQQPV
jgi:hypothetical protein